MESRLPATMVVFCTVLWCNTSADVLRGTTPSPTHKTAGLYIPAMGHYRQLKFLQTNPPLSDSQHLISPPSANQNQTTNPPSANLNQTNNPQSANLNQTTNPPSADRPQLNKPPRIIMYSLAHSFRPRESQSETTITTDPEYYE